MNIDVILLLLVGKRKDIDEAKIKKYVFQNLINKKQQKVKLSNLMYDMSTCNMNTYLVCYIIQYPAHYPVALFKFRTEMTVAEFCGNS